VGYPGHYPKNLPISGLANAGKSGQTLIFQAGTTTSELGELVTSGGRVLAVTSYGETLQAAVQHSLKELEQIHFEGMYFREDIGYEFS
jgi:phosphoribosylamine--glycine ligase